MLSSGYVHPSARKALQLLGHGKDTVEVFARDDVGRVDLEAVRRRLGELDGAPAVLVATAMAQRRRLRPAGRPAGLAEEFGAWLHVDGAFGLFAAVSPRTAHLTAGIERADLIAADAHKAQRALRERVRAQSATRPGSGRRSACRGRPTCRGRTTLAAATGCWARSPRGGRGPADLGHPGRLRPRRPGAGRAALRPGRPPGRGRGRRPRPGAPGRGPAQRRLARYRPPDLSEPELDDVNRRLRRGPARRRPGVRRRHRLRRTGAAPAISNWRTTADDLDLFVEVVRELGAKAASAGRS